MANLFMAVVWAVLAGVLFAWQAYSPDQRGLTLGNSQVSIGWLALVLAGYNLVRWWSTRMLKRSKRMLQASSAADKSGDSGGGRGGQQITDPQFSLKPEPEDKDILPRA
jgi:hypothetical protein